MLFEALTGRLPFDGTPAQMMLRKQFADGPDPARLHPSLPADVCGLCRELLRRDPAARPPIERVEEVLGRSPAPRARRTAEWAASSWVGREGELRALEAALDECRRRPLIVDLEGRSGIGKSALVERFVAGRRERGDALVLAGRCFERERVPHETLDGMVDSLAQHLAALPAGETEAL